MIHKLGKNGDFWDTCYLNSYILKIYSHLQCTISNDSDAHMLKDFFVDRRSLKGHVGLNAQAEIDRILHRMVDELLVPGISITVLQDGQTLFQRRYGFANLDFKTRSTPRNQYFE
ncbi:hypothetical protein [Pareuzebyella sediminis]|uniref:hypothetical protein n=1 Tax=Pareuzebyella sediminis TaxID=2607998 RepID=UPI0011EF2611|nr:hypothetical protein [Pareuzebyella sediminis]